MLPAAKFCVVHSFFLSPPGSIANMPQKPIKIQKKIHKAEPSRNGKKTHTKKGGARQVILLAAEEVSDNMECDAQVNSTSRPTRASNYSGTRTARWGMGLARMHTCHAWPLACLHAPDMGCLGRPTRSSVP